MVNIKPTINIYDDEGNLTKAYDKAINKMINQTFDIDLEQFDFDEVAKGKCKEFDDLVTKLCAKSGLGSADIYSMLLERFIAEYDMDYDVNHVYGLDELEELKKTTKRSLKESHGFDEKIVTVNYHDYLLQGGDFSTNRYKVSIIPDYNIFEDGIACECFVDCYDYGDKASLPYRNKIGVHYKVWITPSGKTKGKLVLDEEELMDKEDFDYIDDSVFIMICEWIDNRYGKELFESKKTTKRSLKESNYDLINDDLLAMCKGSTKQLIYAIDDYQSNYSDKSLKELKRRIEEVEDLCNKILYQINKR